MSVLPTVRVKILVERYNPLVDLTKGSYIFHLMIAELIFFRGENTSDGAKGWLGYASDAQARREVDVPVIR